MEVVGNRPLFTIVDSYFKTMAIDMDYEINKDTYDEMIRNLTLEILYEIDDFIYTRVEELKNNE